MSIRHDYTKPACPHPDCGGDGRYGVTGYQCAECGHYYPRNRVRMDSDSELRCRDGMGCAVRRPRPRRARTPQGQNTGFLRHLAAK